jgi:hypothetical protein
MLWPVGRSRWSGCAGRWIRFGCPVTATGGSCWRLMAASGRGDLTRSVVLPHLRSWQGAGSDDPELAVLVRGRAGAGPDLVDGGPGRGAAAPERRRHRGHRRPHEPHRGRRRSFGLGPGSPGRRGSTRPGLSTKDNNGYLETSCRAARCGWVCRARRRSRTAARCAGHRVARRPHRVGAGVWGLRSGGGEQPEGVDAGEGVGEGAGSFEIAHGGLHPRGCQGPSLHRGRGCAP